MFYDWGRNQISNGGEYTDRDHSVWRTLSKDEWRYLIHGRTDADSLFAYGKVDGVNGLILLPDNWTKPAGAHFETSVGKKLFKEDKGNGFVLNTIADPYHNVYSASEWTDMEQSGAVFLPCGGNRYYRHETIGVGTGGYYWSSNELNGGHDGYAISFGKDVFYYEGADAKMTGLSVRLVKDVNSATALDQMTNDKSQMTNKIIKDNQILILRGDKTYTITGQEIIVP